jgi:hypothetical protein
MLARRRHRRCPCPVDFGTSRRQLSEKSTRTFRVSKGQYSTILFCNAGVRRRRRTWASAARNALMLAVERLLRSTSSTFSSPPSIAPVVSDRGNRSVDSDVDGEGCLNAHRQLSAITGTLSAMRRNDCPRWAGICTLGDETDYFLKAARPGRHAHVHATQGPQPQASPPHVADPASVAAGPRWHGLRRSHFPCERFAPSLHPCRIRKQVPRLVQSSRSSTLFRSRLAQGGRPARPQ